MMQRLFSSGVSYTTRIRLPGPATKIFKRNDTTFIFRPRERSRAEVAKHNEALLSYSKEQQTVVPQPQNAMPLIAEIYPIEVEGKIASCDGGSGPLGHPRVFINIEDGLPSACGYCGLRFIKRAHHHH